MGDKISTPSDHCCCKIHYLLYILSHNILVRPARVPVVGIAKPILVEKGKEKKNLYIEATST